MSDLSDIEEPNDLLIDGLDEDGITEKAKKRRAFTVEKKLEVVSYAKIHSNNAASKHFKICRSTIAGWKDQEQDLILLRDTTPKACRLPGAGRHLRDGKFDEVECNKLETAADSNEQVAVDSQKRKSLRNLQKIFVLQPNDVWDPTKGETTDSEYDESSLEDAPPILIKEGGPISIDELPTYEGEGPSEAKKMRRSFTVEQKLEAINFAKAHSKNEASRFFKIDRSTIRTWAKQEKDLVSLQNSRAKPKCRLPGGGRHPRDQYFDEQLAQWVRTQYANGQHISRRTIQSQAQEMMAIHMATSYLGADEGTFFKASKGWLEKFLARHNFRERNPVVTKRRRGRKKGEDGYVSDESLVAELVDESH